MLLKHIAYGIEFFIWLSFTVPTALLAYQLNITVHYLRLLQCVLSAYGISDIFRATRRNVFLKLLFSNDSLQSAVGPFSVQENKNSCS